MGAVLPAIYQCNTTDTVDGDVAVAIGKGARTKYEKWFLAMPWGTKALSIGIHDLVWLKGNHECLCRRLAYLGVSEKPQN